MKSIQEILVPGARLIMEEANDGAESECLVLLHGLAGDRSLWDFVWDDLKTGRRAIRYDLRGFGGSVALDHDEFRHTTDLERLLEALKIERCTLAGVSLGGSVALNFALDHPHRLSHLVLISPGMTGWDWSDDWRARWRAVVHRAKAGDLSGAREMWWAHPLFATTRAIPEAAQKFRETLWAYSGAIWAEGDREEAMLPDLDRLPLLDVPTLLLSGVADMPDFLLIADMIEALGADVHRIDYEGAGHMLNLERPGEITKEILNFLG